MATLTGGSETNVGANEVDHVLTPLIHCCLSTICRFNCFPKIEKNIIIVISINQLMSNYNKLRLITHLRQC